MCCSDVYIFDTRLPDCLVNELKQTVGQTFDETCMYYCFKWLFEEWCLIRFAVISFSGTFLGLKTVTTLSESLLEWVMHVPNMTCAVHSTETILFGDMKHRAQDSIMSVARRPGLTVTGVGWIYLASLLRNSQVWQKRILSTKEQR